MSSGITFRPLNRKYTCVDKGQWGNMWVFKPDGTKDYRTPCFIIDADDYPVGSTIEIKLPEKSDERKSEHENRSP